MARQILWSSCEVQCMERRLKREDCKHTNPDFDFSKWEILIGPNDWEDHASGKDGVERYRIHNLPTASSCSGLYELGVASIPPTEGHRLRKLDWENVIVVYLGQADNVRTRLQEYGRSGSHLEHGNLVTSRRNYESSSPQRGQGLFKDIFSKGYAIMFRWVPIKSKMEAEKMEIELLRSYDYAWNRKGNGMCRHADILTKLIHSSPNPGLSPLRRLLQWKKEAFTKRVGISIDAIEPPPSEQLEPPLGLKGYLLPRIFKFSSSQLQFLPQDSNSVNDQVICGVATGHGSICLSRPLPGRKRCAEHKGKKITGSGSASSRMTASTGILLEDGTKGCELNNARRITSPALFEICSPFQQNQSQLAQEMFQHEKESDICGVVYGDGRVCTARPVLGRKRCERHKGKRVLAAMASRRMTASTGILLQEDGTKGCELSNARRITSPALDEICSPFQQNQSQFQHEKESDICGVVYGDGCVCMARPVLGRKRCERHKGRHVLPAMASVDKIFNSPQLNNICGVINGYGYACSRPPVPGRKRCEEHKGRRLV